MACISLAALGNFSPKFYDCRDAYLQCETCAKFKRVKKDFTRDFYTRSIEKFDRLNSYSREQDTRHCHKIYTKKY